MASAELRDNGRNLDGLWESLNTYCVDFDEVDPCTNDTLVVNLLNVSQSLKYFKIGTSMDIVKHYKS